MKKLFLSTIIAGSCLAVTAQTPDTTRQQQWNNGTPPDSTTQQQWNNTNPPDSLRLNPQVAPVEMAPSATITTDTVNMVPSQPVNTDVRNTDPMADTVNMKTTTVPVVPDANNTITPSATVTTSDTTVTTNVVVPGETVPVQSTMPAGPVTTAATLPRGVNIPEASTLTTGLGKWSALPVLNTFVPEDVVNKLKMEHGDKLYDITMLKTGENQYSYSARVQENGVYNTVIVAGDTIPATAATTVTQ